MGLTKTNLFTEEQNAIAKTAKVIGHPARIAIIEYLLSKNSCINSHLVDELGLAQATISQHLKELKNVGIIKGTIEGTSMSYCIDSEVWLEIKSSFNELFDKINQCNSEGCC